MSLLNPKKHQREIHEERTLDPATKITPSKISIIGDTGKQISNSDGVDPKNGLHNCPTTNASDLGEGLPRVKNRLSDDRLRSPHANSMLRCKLTTDYQVSENLT